MIATPLSTPGIHADPGTARVLSACLQALVDTHSPLDLTKLLEEYDAYDAGTFAPFGTANPATQAEIHTDISRLAHILDEVAQGRTVEA